ncbi:hypothetical protein Tco_1520616 [Tanacetum coccineum]
MKWRFLTEQSALWRTVIREFYGEDWALSSPINLLSGNRVWSDIVKAIKNIEGIDLNFKKSFVRKVADGANTSFWHNPWCGDGTSLKNKFPRLYALESFKDYKVKDRGLVINEAWVGSWAWRIPPRGRALDDLNALDSSLSSTLFHPNGHDKWIWTCDATDIFKVSTLSKILEMNLLRVHSFGAHHN